MCVYEWNAPRDVILTAAVRRLQASDNQCNSQARSIPPVCCAESSTLDALTNGSLGFSHWTFFVMSSW